MRLRRQLGAFVKDVEIRFVGVDAVAGLAGDFCDDAEFEELAKGGVGGGFREVELGDEARGGDDGVLLHELMHAGGGAGGAAEVVDTRAVGLEELEEEGDRVGGLTGGLIHAGEEEVDPRFVELPPE